jgi:hypothetical protein
VTASERTRSDRNELRYVVGAVVVVAFVLVAQVAVGGARQALSNEPSFLEKVQTCLTERSRPFGPADDDAVASSAERGALRTDVEGNVVTVALGGSESDAERVYRAYVVVAPEDVVRTRIERRRKVVLLWEHEPTTSQREFMYLCTLDAQE